MSEPAVDQRDPDEIAGECDDCERWIVGEVTCPYCDGSVISVEGIGEVSDDALDDAAFELRQQASHIGWTDPEREMEYDAIASHLLDLRGDEPEPSGLLARIREVFGR